jgi:hypothetical protein
VREKGIFEKAGPTMKKAPKYLTPLGFAKPRTQTPRTSRAQLRRKKGALRFHLSEK